ncbi:MAG: sugar ABC transporter ATP-binding protein [Acidibrevibacterium sp.]|uniref:sugar ABC transporter ATP-binding protein n=1 Tax=Acidibrevibacterium sp. TaxID=2606776 RepID=UPI003D0314BC
MTAPLIELHDVSKSFGGVRALAGVSLAIGQGEIHCLAGENGSGKSTLIKIIAGVHRPDAGTLRIDGREVAALDPITAIGHGVQVIYQDFSLFPALSVAENLALPSEVHARRRFVSWSGVRALARAALARLGVTIDLAATVETLTTAERQLVAIARALMSAPRLLIMDEPTTALTGREVARLFAIVRDIQAQGIAVLFVSHKMREMLEISERITVLRNGAVAAAGAASGFDEVTLTRAMTGQDFATQAYRWTPHDGGAARLELRSLAVPGVLAPIDAAVHSGEIVGITGLLGSGRTDLALTLFGMRPHYQGEIRIDGAPVAVRDVAAAIKAGVAYVPEDRLTEGLFLSRSIHRNLLATSYDAMTRHLFIDFARARTHADAMMRQMRITTEDGTLPVASLSGGNQQRVLIGRWLMGKARILILNGPTVGVDVGSKAGIHERIRDLAREGDLAVLLISDDLPEIIQNCNRVLIMHRGRLVEACDTAALSETALAEKLKALT